MGLVSTGSQKTVGRVKGGQIQGHREKRGQNESANGKNRGRAKLELGELRELSWCVIYTYCMCIFKYACCCRTFFFPSSMALACSRSCSL